MKAFFALCVMACALLLLGCASSSERGPEVGPMSRTAGGPNVIGTLDDYLARQPGVTVNGSGPRARIHLSGADYPNPPLFVIDGVAIGYDFGAVWTRAPMADVQSVRVIRANDTAAVLYGVRGGNGVVEITMKRGE
jgi:hypothetical protein